MASRHLGYIAAQFWVVGAIDRGHTPLTEAFFNLISIIEIVANPGWLHHIDILLHPSAAKLSLLPPVNWLWSKLFSKNVKPAPQNIIEIILQ